MKVVLPYGHEKISLEIPDKNVVGILEPRDISGVSDPLKEIKNALENPLDAPRISETVEKGDKIAIVVDDHTRPAPSYLMVPPILDELEKAGIPMSDVFIIFACGTHRPVKPEEMKKLLGEETLKRVPKENIVSHNCDAPDLVYCGKTSRGTPVYVNRLYYEADVKILTGDITLHYYAGYGGGPKSILPGISGRITIQHNHAMLLDPNAKMGVAKGNPIHEDIMEAAKKAGVDFVLNVVMNTKKEIVKAYAGKLETVFYTGIKLIDQIYKVPIECKPDIIVASPGGHPFDINFYQATKGLYTADLAVKDGGVIILLAACPEGIGHKVFHEWMLKYKNSREVGDALRREFILGGHKALYLYSIVERVKVYLKTEMNPELVKNVLKCTPIEDPQRALNELLKENNDALVCVMPFANETLPVVKK